MQEKDIVNDVLSMTKASMNQYQSAIIESSCQSLRSSLQQLRDGAEQFHYQLFKVAEQKGYYKPAIQATQQEIQQTKDSLLQG